MEYILFKNIKSDFADSQTIQLYSGEDLAQIVKKLKNEFSLYKDAKFLAPNLKTKNEIICLKIDEDTFVYSVNCTKGAKTLPWGEIEPDYYTDFILDMKRWLKNHFNPEIGNLDKMNKSLAHNFHSNESTISSGYTIS